MKQVFVMAAALMLSAASMAQTTQKKPMKKDKMNVDSTHMMHNNMSKDSMNMNKSNKKMKMKSKSTKTQVDSSGMMN